MLHAKLLRSCPTLCEPMVALQVPLCLGFSGHWSELPCLPPGDLLNPGIELASLVSPALAGGYFTASDAWEAHTYIHVCPLFWIFCPLGHHRAWVELPVLCSRFSLVICFSVVSVVYTSVPSWADDRVKGKARLAERIPHLLCLLRGRMCAAARASRGTELRHLSRGRDGSRCGPGPGLLLAASFPPHPLFFILNFSSSVWTHAPLSHLKSVLRSAAPLSDAQTLVSPPPGRSLRSVHFVSSHALWICCRLLFIPAVLLSSLCLLQIQLFDCQVFFSVLSVVVLKLLVSEPLQNWRFRRIFYLWKLSNRNESLDI